MFYFFFLFEGVHSTAHHNTVLPLLLLLQQSDQLPTEQPISDEEPLHSQLLLPELLLPRREHDRVRAQLH